MVKPLVSVIIPVKNGERFLSQSIESVLAQDYRPIEIIVIDGRSTDRTAEIAGSFDEVQYVEQINEGIPDAWNLGIDRANGPLLAFISSDDRWTPQKLTCQVGHMERHPEQLYTIAMFRYFLEQGHTIPKGFNPQLLDRDLIGRIMETLVARREVFEKVGRFDTSFRIGEDVDWYARAKDMAVPMAVISEVLLHKRIHDQNASADAAVGTPLLLRIVRESIQRQRQQATTDRKGDESRA